MLSERPVCLRAISVQPAVTEIPEMLRNRVCISVMELARYTVVVLLSMPPPSPSCSLFYSGNEIFNILTPAHVAREHGMYFLICGTMILAFECMGYEYFSGIATTAHGYACFGKAVDDIPIFFWLADMFQ